MLHGLAEVTEGGEEVEGHGSLEMLVSSVLYRYHLAVASVVDEDIDVAELFNRPVEDPL
nr:hypothetical protein [Halocatena pleomorpha]